MRINAERRNSDHAKNNLSSGNYFAGMIFVSLGIVLCVKCKLGVSPISSVPYVLGFLTPLTFGTLTMLFHFCNSIIQYILEKKLINVKVLLQIPVAFLFGIIIDFFKNIMSFNAENLMVKIFLMIMSIIFTALGMHFMLSMRLVQNPPDGTVNILVHLLNKNIGTVKIYYDILMVIISVILGIVFLHDLNVFGIATILSAIFVGKTLTLMKKIFDWKSL